MDISFFFPEDIKEFMKNNKIKKSEIINYSKWEETMEEDLKSFKKKPKKVKVVINGFRKIIFESERRPYKIKTKEIEIKPEKISKEKPIVGVSSSFRTILKDWTIFYLIYK